MKKILLTLLLGVFVTHLTYAQAQIEFKEEVFEFGEIAEGLLATHVFEFTNTGNSTLILTNVRTSCTCTQTFWPKEPIPPGESNQIRVEFDTNNKVGPFNRNIAVSSNATTPNKQLFIQGNVLKKTN